MLANKKYALLVAMHDIMITPSNGNIFRVIGHLRGGGGGGGWGHTKASDAEL